MPILAGWLVDNTNWRWVAVVWGVSGVVGTVVLRRIANPSLSLAPLRHGGLVLLLIVLVLSLLATTGLALLASSLMTVETPIWVAILIMCAYAGSAIGAGVALTNGIMNLAPPEESGSAASYRSAASNLGGAIGVALMTAVVFGAAATSLQEQSAASGLDQATVPAIGKDMRSGATSEEASSQFAVPIEEVDQIDEMQRNAYMSGFQAHGQLGGLVTLMAAAMFFLIRRRQESAVFAGAPDSKVGTGRG